MIAIVIGHRLSSQGARNTHGQTEYTWNTQLAADVKAALLVYGVPAEVYERPNHSAGYGELAQLLNRDQVAAVVSLHFNGGPAAATGTETLCHPASLLGQDLASRIQHHVVQCLGLRDRGVKQQTHNDRGKELKILTRTKAPAVIVESYFGSNDQDTAVATLKRASGDLGKAIAMGVVDWRDTP